MASTQASPVPPVDESQEDWEETASGRRPGDDPFLPEEGFFWWLPRALAMALVLVALGLLAAATVHHGKYRLVKSDDGMAVLERGRFYPRGWTTYVPDGAIEAWTPVLWPAQSVDPPMEGEFRDLADTYLGFVRTRVVEHPDDLELLALMEVQEESFEAWYRGRWSGEEPPAAGSLRAKRDAQAAEQAEALKQAEAQEATRLANEAAEVAAARAAEEAEAERARARRMLTEEEVLDQARSYAARRRGLLTDAEDLLATLPPAGTPEEARDRDAVESFIRSMDTPVVPAPEPPVE